nr:glycosyltransferase family 4 protein [Cryobacterium sp. M91]
MRGFPEYLRDEGWDVHVVSAPGPALSALGTVPGIATHAVAMVRQPSPLQDLRSLIAWHRLLRQVRPNVISVGTPKAALLGGIAGFLAKVPRRIYILRGLRLETCSGMQRRMLAALERISMGVAHDVVSVSESLSRRVVEYGLVSAAKVRVLGHGSSNGVDVEAFTRDSFAPGKIASLAESLGIVAEVPVIGFVGRLSADKGLTVLSEARALLTQRGVDHQLLVVGGLDEGEDGSLIEAIRFSGRQMIATGHVHDTRPYFQLMDIFCLPTYREGFPNVVLESAASGVPAVTTDATGAVDSVVTEITGLIVAVGSATELADALERLIADESLRSRMGEAARIRVTAQFDRADVWDRLNTYYVESLHS